MVVIWLLSRLRSTEYVVKGNLNVSEEIEAIVLLLKDTETVVAEGKLKTFFGRVVIWLLWRFRETDDDAEVNLNAPEEIEVILLFFKSIEMDVALVIKLKAPDWTNVILLYDRETIDRNGNLEIWLGTLVSWLEDAFIEITGLNPGARKASKMRLSCRSFKFLYAQSITMSVLYPLYPTQLQGELDDEMGQIRAQLDGLKIIPIW